MAKVEVDQNLCVGCGMCTQQNEEYFAFGEDGLSHVIKEEVPSEDVDNIKESVEICPTEAIKLTEEE